MIVQRRGVAAADVTAHPQAVLRASKLGREPVLVSQKAASGPSHAHTIHTTTHTHTPSTHLLDDLLLVQSAGQLLHVDPLLHIVPAMRRAEGRH